MKVKNTHRFTNWAKNESCTAMQYAQPESADEISELVATSGKVRMVGTGHSWSPACISNQTLINLDRFNKIISISDDKTRAVIQPGIKLWQLNEQLDANGLALRNLGSISKQSVAGAVSTGTHGSGINYQILGSQVESLTFVKADGSIKKVMKTEQEELFNLSLVNLGALGVISEMEIRVVPSFQLHEKVELMAFDEAMERMNDLIHSCEHFKMWWFPHTDKVILHHHSVTQQPVNDSRVRQWMMDEFISVYIYRFLLQIGTIKRKWRKSINSLLLHSFDRPIDRIEKSYKVFNVPEPPLHREAEWSFDTSKTTEVLKAYKALIDRSKHRINFLQEIRFTKADNFALSPCYGRDSVWIGCYNADNFGWPELLNDFELLAQQYQGRPHWGKEYRVGSSYIKAQYPEFNAFNKLRLEWDKDRKFENAYISAIFNE